MKQVKVGLVGLGFMGTTHWGIYKSFKNAKIVALAPAFTSMQSFSIFPLDAIHTRPYDVHSGSPSSRSKTSCRTKLP